MLSGGTAGSFFALRNRLGLASFYALCILESSCTWLPWKRYHYQASVLEAEHKS